MAVNDIYTLPKKIRTMREMEDLLNAEQAEIEILKQTVEHIEKELHIHSSTLLLGRYEKQFALPTNLSESPEERRGRLIAKLNARQMTTVETIKELTQVISGGTSEVIEHFQDYRISIIVYVPESIRNTFYKTLKNQIEEIKPAHLGLSITYVIGLKTNMYLGTAISEYKEEVIC